MYRSSSRSAIYPTSAFLICWRVPQTSTFGSWDPQCLLHAIISHHPFSLTAAAPDMQILAFHPSPANFIIDLHTSIESQSPFPAFLDPGISFIGYLPGPHRQTSNQSSPPNVLLTFQGAHICENERYCDPGLCIEYVYYSPFPAQLATESS